MACQQDNWKATPATQATTEQSITVSPKLEVANTSHITTSSPTEPTTIAQDCDDIWDQGYTENYGIYEIRPNPTCTSQLSFEAVCDLETVCGGWIVFQRRFDGSEDFYRGWEDYKNGFGNLTGEFWLGLEKLHRLTRNGDWQLRVELEDFSGSTVYAEYTNFFVGDKSTYYRLSLGVDVYSGDAGNCLERHSNMAFSTYDEDRDTNRDNNCAVRYEGGWWYFDCYDANLNGRYFGYPTTVNTGIKWNRWTNKVLKKCEMKIRRMQNP